LDDDPYLKENVLTEKKYMDLYWKFFEFQDELKKELSELPKLRKFAKPSFKNSDGNEDFQKT